MLALEGDFTPKAQVVADEDRGADAEAVSERPVIARYGARARTHSRFARIPAFPKPRDRITAGRSWRAQGVVGRP